MTEKHTPTPWEIWPHGQNGQICIGHLESHSNLVRAVCEVDSQDTANAELIVRAVNSHDALLDAARAAETKLDRLLQTSGTNWARFNGVPDALMQLRAAIAAATGEGE